MSTTKEAVRAGVLSGAAFAFGMGVFATIVQGGTFWEATQSADLVLLAGRLVGPLLAGVVFGCCMGFVIARATKQLSIPEGERPEWCRADEVLLRQGAANHWRGAINYGGWLYLTSSRLRFVPHRMLQSQDPQEWSLVEVAGSELVRTMGLIPNGLALRLQDGSEERFVVRLSERDDLRNAIEDARAAVQIGPPPPAPESE